MPNLLISKEDSGRVFDIAANDVVTVNDAATGERKAKRAAETERYVGTVAHRSDTAPG